MNKEREKNKPDVVAHHHLEDAEEFFLGDELVIVRVVHFESESKFALARVQLVLSVLFDGSEMGQHLSRETSFLLLIQTIVFISIANLHELTKVKLIL